MMDGMTRLKPCPFCGQTARAALQGDNRLVIACTNGCQCQTSTKVKAEDSFFTRMLFDDILDAYEDAAAQWNKRWHDDG